MTRQERFEAMWADRHEVPVESMAQYRFKDSDGYRLPDMAAHYRTFCAAWDMLEAEVPMVRMTDCTFIGSNLDGSPPMRYSLGADGMARLAVIDMRGWTCRGPGHDEFVKPAMLLSESLH